MSKSNCNCNTQSFYVNRKCAGYYAQGSTTWKIPATTIDNLKSGSLITAADLNTVKNKIRDQVKRVNTNRASQGWSQIALTEATNYNSNTKITASQYNNIRNMFNGVSSNDYGVSKSPGNLIYAENWKIIAERFNQTVMDCICNTDCACNTVCSVVSDCGCNYR